MKVQGEGGCKGKISGCLAAYTKGNGQMLGSRMKKVRRDLTIL